MKFLPTNWDGMPTVKKFNHLTIICCGANTAQFTEKNGCDAVVAWKSGRMTAQSVLNTNTYTQIEIKTTRADVGPGRAQLQSQHESC